MKEVKAEVCVYQIVSVEQMRALEHEADSRGLSYAQMMENAGKAAATLINQRFGKRKGKSIVGLVGSGNNGGDALVALNHLQCQGWDTHAYLIKERKEHDLLVEQYLAGGGNVDRFSNDENHSLLDNLTKHCHFLLDGIFGTGVRLPLRGEIEEVLQHLRDAEKLPYIIALDCPSGVDCDSGEADVAAVHAQWTISMAAVKRGLLEFPAFEHVGELSVVEIGLPADLEVWKGGREFCMDESAAAAMLPARPVQAHKGTFGTAVIFAGSRAYPGAAYLAAKAAYLAGAGLVILASIAEVRQAIAGTLPEATWYLLQTQDEGFGWDETTSLPAVLQKASAILAGPGWGTHPSAAILLERLFDIMKENPRTPLIIDADGLNLLSQHVELFKKLPANCILTPHPGEMARLSGLAVEEIQKDRQTIARTYAKKWNAILVLKGALTVIADPCGRLVVNPVATPALAKAGSGDVLAGMLAGLAAQGIDGLDAACMACWMHGRAGMLAERAVGHSASVMASDILRSIPWVFRILLKRKAG